MTKGALYLGLMSGTSADGIDLALVDFSGSTPQLVAKYYQAYDQYTHQQITSLYQMANNEIDRAFSLDVELAKQFADAIKQFLAQEKLSSSDIIAIGNHGQTIRHRPQAISKTPLAKEPKKNQAPFTLQIGCNQTLATLTDIRVIGQFRRKDMALGGQGAPLVPAFHQALFVEYSTDIFVVNIGGIANITYLPAAKDKTNRNKTILGFDTGPGNALMDDWFQKFHQGRYDKNGAWAAQGVINQQLLEDLLNDSFFQLPPPKSTGRERFHLAWLLEKLEDCKIQPADVQATLAALTAQSIANAINALSNTGKVYLCGGGVQNGHLYQLIAQQLENFQLASTDLVNVDSDALEAIAFAWFAYAFDQQITGNIPSVTGASKAAVLGAAFAP